MRKILLLTLVLTIAASAGAFYLLPNADDLPTRIGHAIVFTILIPQLVAIWALLTSLGLFKRELKIAYYLLSLSILFLSLNQLQLPVTSLVTIDPIILSWFITGSTLMGGLLMYLSMYRFAKLLKVKAFIWSSFAAVTVFSLLLAFASTFIPHITYPVSEKLVDGIFATYVAGGGFATAAAITALLIRAKLAPSYKNAMGWLAAGAIMLAFSAFHETLIRLLPVFNQESFYWYSIYAVSLWPLLLVAITFLIASLLFRKLSRELSELPENADFLDVVNYTAQLASDPKAIDIILDKVREITAIGMKGDTLSAANESALLNVYRQLETYLVTKDPLLKITREDLRTRLPNNFRQKL